ncbi:hypothetical protein GCM10018779_04470 [Streptomyces griseocarneus]|nr:hypothetical protein GCM10018779_04470 [Streptomyces griseocarneus]
MFGERVEGGADAGGAVGERHLAPGAVLVEGGPYGPVGGGRVEAGRPGDRGAVDGGGGGERVAVGVPGAVPEVEDAVVAEGLGGDGPAASPGGRPVRAGLEGEGGCHGRSPLSVHGRGGELTLPTER